ncbi:hypothetical protein [Roseibium aggregatum]|uniref:hypothetical protein n=1 Tax=Roseibium aggregatum TaxID=187304 RepID=UPI003A976A0A
MYFDEKISEWVNFYFFMRLLIFAIEYTNYNHNQTAKYFSDFYFNEFLLNERDRHAAGRRLRLASHEWLTPGSFGHRMEPKPRRATAINAKTEKSEMICWRLKAQADNA